VWEAKLAQSDTASTQPPAAAATTGQEGDVNHLAYYYSNNNPYNLVDLPQETLLLNPALAQHMSRTGYSHPQPQEPPVDQPQYGRPQPYMVCTQLH
jgi:hypothetical protein